jgi:putative transposase
MRLSNGQVRKRRRTYNHPGDAHELTFSCYRRLKFLDRDRTRTWLIEALDRARRKHDLEIWAYVIMPEHAHVLIWPRLTNYSMENILRSIKQSVARRAIGHLRKHRPDWLGHLQHTRADGEVETHFWQPGGGYDRNIVRVKSAENSIVYLHNNPVRRELVKRAEDWPWSSARHYAGMGGSALRIDPARL